MRTPSGRPGAISSIFSFHAIDQLARVDPVAGHDHATGRLAFPFHQRRHPEGAPHLHGRDVFHLDRDPRRRADHDAGNVGLAGDQPDTAHDRPGAVGFEHVAADVLVAVLDRRHHRAERDAVATQSHWVDVDLVLPHVAPDRRDFGDAGDGVQLITHEPVLEAAQFLEGVPVAFERVPEDVPDARGVGAERRHDPFRQRRAHQVQPLEHSCTREVQVDVVLEDHVDHRKAERRLRSDHTNACEPLQVRRQRIRDLVLDLLRAVPEPVAEDDHLVVGEIGDRVHRRVAQGPVAPGAKRQEGDDHDEAVFERKLDETVDHGDSHIRRRPGQTRPGLETRQDTRVP